MCVLDDASTVLSHPGWRHNQRLGLPSRMRDRTKTNVCQIVCACMFVGMYTGTPVRMYYVLYMHVICTYLRTCMPMYMYVCMSECICPCIRCVYTWVGRYTYDMCVCVCVIVARGCPCMRICQRRKVTKIDGRLQIAARAQITLTQTVGQKENESTTE